MNDAAVAALWAALTRVIKRLERLEHANEIIEARIRARLKEEVEARRLR